MSGIIQIPRIATEYGLYDGPAVPGLPYGAGQPVVLPFQNMSRTLKPKTTIAIPASVDANKTYSLNVNGEVITAATGGSTTQAQLGAMILAALRSRMKLTMGHKITMSGSLITIESMNPGSTLTVAATSNSTTTGDLTVTQVTVSGEDAIIPFGRFVGRKFSYPKKTAALISSPSTTYATGQDGFMVYGVTHSTQAGERMGRAEQAVGGYRPLDTMNVWVDRGNAEGIWVECTGEGDVTIDDSFGSSNLFIATSAGNEGKLTKDDTTYSGRSLQGQVEVLQDAVTVFDWNIALISFGKLSL